MIARRLCKAALTSKVHAALTAPAMQETYW